MSAAPGWYPDNVGTIRYWDGGQWTEHIQPVAPVVPEMPAQLVQYAPPVAPVYDVQPYPQQIVAAKTTNGVSTAGFVVGLVSVVLPIFFGLAAGITGLVLSIVGASKSKHTGSGRGLAIAGIILSSVGILFIL